jgi:NAD(P)-dependent dehydrogenase (short-subunit alcohol dehydrogenase family)
VSKVLVLGATGRAGRRISAELLSAGVNVALAGRDEARLREVANDLRVPAETTQVVDVQDEQAVTSAVADADIVLNTVGPFMSLAPLVIAACLRNASSYVDLANEQPAVASLLARDQAAKDAGVSLVTGAGLGLVAAEYLTLGLTSDMVAPPRSVRSALLTWNSAPSAGVKASAAAAMQVGSTRYVEGELVHGAIGADFWQVNLAGRSRTLVAAPLGDVEAVRRASGARDVAAFVEAPPGAGVDDAEPRCVVHVEVVDDQGVARSASVEAGDSLTITSRLAVRVLLGVLERGRAGAWTPGGLLGGADFDDVLAR